MPPEGDTVVVDPAAAPVVDPAAAAKPWYEGADAETIGHIQTKGWHEKTPAEAALAAIQAHREAERYVGAPADRIIKLPKDATDEAGWADVHTRLGVPKEAKDYDLTGVKFADGTEPGADFVDWFKTTAKAANIPASQAQQVAAAFVKYVEGADGAEIAERTAKLAEEHKTLDASWGQNKELNLFVAKKGAEKLGFTPEHVNALEGVVGYAKIMEALRQVGELSGEARFLGNGNPNLNGGVMTVEQAVSRKAELMKDEGWVKRYTAGGAAENRELQSLLTIIVGDDTAASRAA